MNFQKFLSCGLALIMSGALCYTSAQSVDNDPSAASQAKNNAVSLPVGVERVASVEGITEYRLPNGLKILLFPDQTKQIITVNITYLVGSRHENYGETGMAHLLEHLVFKGTPKRPNIPAELTARGARPNGTTWTDRTNYFETFAASDENLEWALDLEANRMVNSFIAKKDLESEFTVVRNELESGENNPFRVLFQKTLAVAYDWHNYGKSTIGARSDIENVPVDRLQAFYKKYYQPDNAVLVVAGKFDETKTLALIKEKFGVIPKPERALPPGYTIEPAQNGEKTVTVRRVGDIQMLMAGYHVPPGAHSDSAAVEVFHSVLTNATAGRLYKNLVETKKAAAVLGLNFQFKEPGYSIFGVQLSKNDSIEAAREALTETIETAHQKPPTEEEVERVKTALLKNIELSLNDPNLVGLRMSEYIARGDWRLFFLYRDRLRKVTSADVARVAGKYFKPSNRTVAQFIPTEKPDRVEIPIVSNEEILAMVRDYKSGEIIAQGEAFDSSPANIEARLKRVQSGGLKVALLPKENRGDSVVGSLTLHFGDEKSLTNRTAAASFVGRMLMRGTSKRSRQQIQDELNRLKTRITFSGGATSTGAAIETTRQNLPEAVKLLGEILRDAQFPESEFEKLKQEQITLLESRRSEPGIVAARALNQHFNIYPKGHPFYIRTIEEEIADARALTVRDVKKFYEDFYGASNGQMTIVGDFDEKEISALIPSVFADWKSPSIFARVKRQHRDVEPINKSLETPDKANATFMGRLTLKIRDDHPDYPALVLGNYIFGGGFLNSRLATRLRQQEGISYSAQSDFDADSLDEAGSFFFYAIGAPENTEKLETAFRDEIKKATTEGFTTQEIEDAKKGWLQSRQLARANDRELVRKINRYQYLDRTIDWDARLAEKIRNLTAEQVSAAMKKYLLPDKITIVKAGNFAKAKAKTAK